MNERLTGLLGMARRAGRITAGFDACRASLSGGRAALALLARDVSPKTEKEVRFAARRTEVVVGGLTKEEMGRAIGSEKPVGVIVTEDRGFAAAIRQAAGRFSEEDGI